jgi:hypothetical protein
MPMKAPQAILRLVAGQQETDYVSAFNLLTRLHMDLRKDGARADLLLRRAALEVAIGHFMAASGSAREASRLAPMSKEAHYLDGLAKLGQALVSAEAIPDTEGTRQAGTSHFVTQACAAMRRAAEMNPEDAEGGEWVQELADFEKSFKDDTSLGLALGEICSAVTIRR